MKYSSIVWASFLSTTLLFSCKNQNQGNNLKGAEEIIPNSDVEENERKIREVQLVLDKIDGFIGSALPTPKVKKIQIINEAHSVSFNPGTNVIIIPYQFTVEGKNKHPKYTRATLAHEYGHALFQTATTSLAKELELDLNPIAKGLYINKVLEYGIELPFNEFFADVVAVLYAKDLHAIEDSLNVVGTKLEGIKGRSLDPRRGRAQKENYNSRSVHTVLSATRYEFGKQYLDDIIDDSNPNFGVILDKLLLSYMCLIDAALKESGKHEPPKWLESYKSMNLRVQDSINYVFSKNGSREEVFSACREHLEKSSR